MEHRLSFSCDYLEGAHPAILQRLCETNFAQTAGYGTDEYCESAREKIRAAYDACITYGAAKTNVIRMLVMV